MANKPRYLIYGQTQRFHTVLQQLADDATFIEGDISKSPADYELLVIDGEAHPPEHMRSFAGWALDALQNNHAVLLLAPTDAHKRALADAGVIHTYIQQGSAAMLIEPRLDPNGRLTNSRGICEQFFPRPEHVKAKLMSVSQDRQGVRSVVESEYVPELPEPSPSAYANFVERVRFVVDALANGRSLVGAESPDPMQPPPGVPSDLYYVTDLLINQHWYPTGTKDKGTGETPPVGHMAVSGHLQVGIYYDNVNDPPQQWIKVYHDGDVQTGGMTYDSKNHRGWSLAEYDIQSGEALEGNQPDGSKIAEDEVSPTNVNGSTQYTSSTNFSVGVNAGTSGLSAPMSYNVGSSTSIAITDWAIAQYAPAYWQFYQQNPYDGRKQDVDGALDKHGVNSLPQISMLGTQYNAQTVWVHQPASTLVRTIYYNYLSTSNYAAWNNGFWGWHGCLWSYWYGEPLSVQIRCDKALPTQ